MRPFAAAPLLASIALIGCQGDEASPQSKPTDPTTDWETGDEPPADEDGDGFTADVDCDDSDAGVFPGAEEICDGIDNDCDALIDAEDESVVDLQTFYADADADGYGDPDSSVEACEAPEGTVANAEDCDDADADASPESAWYADADTDGYGDPAAEVLACEQPEGTVSNAVDCDDGDDTVNPDTVWYTDGDSDGYGDPAVSVTQCEAPSGTVRDDTDCDDGASDSYPGAPELCDGIDHDCDGDGYDSESTDASIWYRDVDSDGYGRVTGLPTPACTQPSGFVADNTDCEDTDGTAYPGSHWTETPNDGIDQDCDGLDVCTDLDCDGYTDIVFANWRENGSTYTTDSYIYNGSATGYVWTDRTALEATAAFAADVADYDQDGYLDVVLAAFLTSDYTTDSVVMWGSATGHGASDSDALDTTGARSVCSGDFDADGYPDALFPAYATNGAVFSVDSVVHYGSSTGFVDSNALSTVGAFDCVVGDLDADGYDDAVVISNTADDSDPATRYTTTSTIFWGASGGLSDADVTDLSTHGARRVEIEDLDQDGWDDLIIANHKANTGLTSDDDESYTMVFWSDAGTFDDADATELLTWGGYDTAIGDFDADGYKDIAVAGWTGASGNSSGSTIFWGSASGWSESDSTNLDSMYTVWVSTSDLDADGYDDLVFSNYRDANTSTDSYVYYGSATGFSTADREDLPTLGSRRNTIADLNDDGWDDIIFTNFFDPTTANRADSVVYYGSATGFDPAVKDDMATFGARWTPVVVGN